MREKPVVYIAGPYTHPDPALNVHEAVRYADAFCMFRITPIVPHLTHLWHLIKPHAIDYWYKYDLELLQLADALYRIPGESIGADKEVEFADKIGIPTFTNSTELINWARDWGKEQNDS